MDQGGEQAHLIMHKKGTDLVFNETYRKKLVSK